MNPMEAKQTNDMQQLVKEFPLVDQLEIVNIYYNAGNQNLVLSRNILNQHYDSADDVFG